MPDNPKSNIIVTQRGQVTLPADVRRRLGIKDGGVLTLEVRRGEIVLRPTAVLELEMYRDEDIAYWNEEDRLDDATRQKLRKRISKAKL